MSKVYSEEVEQMYSCLRDLRQSGIIGFFRHNIKQHISNWYKENDRE